MSRHERGGRGFKKVLSTEERRTSALQGNSREDRRENYLHIRRQVYVKERGEIPLPIFHQTGKRHEERGISGGKKDLEGGGRTSAGSLRQREPLTIRRQQSDPQKKKEKKKKKKKNCWRDVSTGGPPNGKKSIREEI